MVGRGTGDAVPLRAAGALIGPGGLAVRLTRIGCACGAAGGPTAFWGGDRRASTMFRPPAKKACDPRMRGESAVVARGGAAPTGAAPAGTFSTPVREAPWRTRPQFPFHGAPPSPAPGRTAACTSAPALGPPSPPHNTVVVRSGEGTGRITAAHQAEARCDTPPLRSPVHAQRAAPATPSSAPARGAPLRVEEWEE